MPQIAFSRLLAPGLARPGLLACGLLATAWGADPARAQERLQRTPPPAQGAPNSPAQSQQVDLELVLMADASGSIDMAEILFQRQGYADALRDPAVQGAIRRTAYGRIALTYVEWGQANSQDVVVPWQVIGDAATAEAFAQALMQAPRRAYGRNAIGAALLFGRDQIVGNGIEGWRQIIDFSADSVANFNGPATEEARAAVLGAGIAINGLAVACRECPSGQANGAALEAAFAQHIIGGPGSFVLTAEGADAFAEAVKRKLILEISGLAGGPDLALDDGR